MIKKSKVTVREIENIEKKKATTLEEDTLERIGKIAKEFY